MRILLVTGEYPPMQGGVGDYTRELSRALSVFGADVHILTSADRSASVDASGARSDLSKPVLSSWELSTETVTGDFDVYKLTDELIKKIEPAKDKILAICKSHNLSPRIGLVLELSVDKTESAPDVAFGARTIRFLADIGAFINVDYRLSKRV